MHHDRSSPEPGKIDPEAFERYRRMFDPIAARMWPWTLDGIEHLPDHNRYLVVANHSGMGTAEIWGLVMAWREHLGDARRIAGMAHPSGFKMPLLADTLYAVGAVEATREGAARARRAGVPLLLFPGGDHEATRPIWQARRVDFAGRRGWIRLAREHNLDVVPLCITGSHITLPILARGRALSWILGTRLLGVHRAPLPALGVATAALSFRAARAVGLGHGASTVAAIASIWLTLMIPWIPSRIGFHLLPPIPAADLSDPAHDGAIYDRVVASLQRVLDAA